MILPVLILIIIISQYKLFKKASQPGWAAFVPLYNIIIWLRIINKPWWWLLLMFIPYAGLIWSIWATNLLCKKFGKNEGFTIGIIFLPFIFFPILAFGSSRFLGYSEYTKKDFYKGFDTSLSNPNSSNIDFFSQTKEGKESKNVYNTKEKDLKTELEIELNKFENKILSKKFDVNLSDDEIDYWYKIICERVMNCNSNTMENSDTEILLENIYGHCDEYVKKHFNEDFEFKRNHTTIRILSYGFILKCIQNIGEKIDMYSSQISDEFKKEIRLKIIHSKASVYGTIKFALISNINKEEIIKMFPEFEDDPMLIEGKNLLEENLMKGFDDMDDENPNKEKLQGIFDGDKRFPIYELTEKQRNNIPSWFKGPFYKNGSEVKSKATGNTFELNAIEKSIFVEIQYNTAMITIYSQVDGSTREDFNNPIFQYMVEVVDNGTKWFKENNKEAYKILFE